MAGGIESPLDEEAGEADLQRQDVVCQVKSVGKQGLAALIQTEEVALEGPVRAALEFDEHAEIGSGYAYGSEPPTFQVRFLGGPESRREQHHQQGAGCEDMPHDGRFLSQGSYRGMMRGIT